MGLHILAVVVLGFKAELKPILIGWWDGITPWRFLFVVSLLGLAGWVLNYLIERWKVQADRIAKLEDSLTAMDLAVRVIAGKLRDTENKFEKELKAIRDGLANEAGTARLEASNLSRLLDGMREDFGRHLGELDHKLNTVLQAIPQAPTHDPKSPLPSPE